MKKKTLHSQFIKDELHVEGQSPKRILTVHSDLMNPTSSDFTLKLPVALDLHKPSEIASISALFLATICDNDSTFSYNILSEYQI